MRLSGLGAMRGPGAILALGDERAAHGFAGDVAGVHENEAALELELDGVPVKRAFEGAGLARAFEGPGDVVAFLLDHESLRGGAGVAGDLHFPGAGDVRGRFLGSGFWRSAGGEGREEGDNG